MEEPQIRFCTSADGTRIAYVVLGHGPGIPIMSVNSWMWGIDGVMEQPAERERLEGWARSRPVATFDNRGTGASERDPADLSLESRAADLSAVVDRLAWPKFHIVAYGESGAVAATYAARNPERVARLALFSPGAKGFGRSEGMVRLIHENWSWARRVIASMTYPNGPVEMQRFLSSSLRRAVNADVAAKLLELWATFDIADLLPQVQAPALVLNFRESPGLAEGREVAALIPDARFLALPGEFAAIYEGSTELTRSISEFLDEGTGAPAVTGPDVTHAASSVSAFHTILFTDIEGSTALTERLGDAKAREVLREHERIVREALKSHSGSEIKTMGDGFMASFGSATKALECAVAIQKAFESPNQQTDKPTNQEEPIQIRIGLNAGEPVAEEGDLFGTAVNMAARIAGQAQGGEILVSDVVRQLVAGKGFSFEGRGEQALKGFEEPVRVYEVRWRDES